MRVLGVLLMVAGALLLLVSCTMTIEVPSTGGSRVVNLGRMAMLASTEHWGFGLLILGAMFSRRDRARPDAPPPSGSGRSYDDDGHRTAAPLVADQRPMSQYRWPGR